MKKILAALCALWVAPHPALAQSETTWANLELGYGWTLADKGTYNLVDKNDRSYMAIMYAKLRYYATDELSLAAGIGATPYRNYGITTVPVFAGLQYDFARIPRLFAYADIGLPLSAETASSDFITSWLTDYSVDYKSGFMANAGVGYRVALSSRRSLYVAAGYHLFHYNLSISFLNGVSGEQLADRRAKHAILLRVGYTFDVKKVFTY
jgi:opacity protein-like surface antigen